MAVIIKTPEEIAGIKEANQIIARLYEEILPQYIKPGISTKELDKYNKAFEIIDKMWDEVEPQKGERLIFVDSDITKFENITIDEYKQKALLNK